MNVYGCVPLAAGLAAALAAGTPLAAQAGAAPTIPSGVSLFFGGARTELAGGPSQRGFFEPGPLGVAVERAVGGRLSVRAELLAQSAAADVQDRARLQRNPRITHTRAGIAAMVRAYPARGGLFAAVGGSLAAQVFCDVDSETGFGPRVVDCEEWDGLELRTPSTAVSAIAAAGVVRGRVGAELRYDHGLNAVIDTPEGGMRPRSLAVIIHYRLSGR